MPNFVNLCHSKITKGYKKTITLKYAEAGTAGSYDAKVVIFLE